MNFLKLKENELPAADLTYLERDIEQNTRILIFYSISKAYK